MLALLVLIKILTTEAQWEKVKDENGVKVYTSYTDESKFKSFKAEVVLNTPIDSLFQFLTDIEYQSEWIGNCKQAQLSDYKLNEYYKYHAQFEMPWPVKDRESYCHLMVQKNTDGSIEVENKPQTAPHSISAGHILISEFYEYYKLTPLSDKKTHYIMMGSYNPGGYLPAWLVNKFLAYGPYDAIEAIRKEVE